MRCKGFSLMETVIFIVLAALVIPIFYLTTQPVIKDMMTPTSYIKARFVAERKMEELMAYRFTDTNLNTVTTMTWSAVTTDAAFQPPTVPAAEYAGYQWQWAINWLRCGASGGSCAGYNDSPAVLSTTSNPGTNTYYKQIDVTVKAPQGMTYQASSAITARY